jgi:hypothetical protein
MSNEEAVALTYDRDLLLLGPKRNALLDLWEVCRYGADSYGDVNYVSVYGQQPGQWYAKGFDLVRRSDWSALRIYNFNDAGQNHGLLLLIRGWRPTAIPPVP